MGNQLILGRALDANGFIAPGAKATVYADGTATLIGVYSDVDGTIAAANPIVADGNGQWPQRFVNETAKVVVTDAAGVPLYTLDPAPTAQGTGAAASAISFNPTIDLPFTNVQSAIEGAAEFATSGFAAFGIGITGNATLLANINATTLGGGVYRFDGTTTGTFPSGVAAADGGLVEAWRQTSGVAMQMLYHATTDRVFHRRMSASVWGTWREALTVNQGAAEGDVIYRGASAWTRLAKGTAGQVLRMNTGATAPEWGSSGPAWQAEVATTSGDDLDLSTAIPNWASELIISLRSVSLSGSDNLLVQLGTAGGYVTSGYTSSGGLAGANTSGASSTAGALVYLGSAGRAFSGFVRLHKISGNIWSFDVCGGDGASNIIGGGGHVDLGATLTQIRLSSSGANTFDAGAASVGWK